MPSNISVKFPFERLRVTLAGQRDFLFGSAEIIADQASWRIGTIEVFGKVPGVGTTKIHPGTELHETVRLALDIQFGEDVDDFVLNKVERHGGYMALFGERLPSVPAFRGVPRQARAMSRTFCL